MSSKQLDKQIECNMNWKHTNFITCVPSKQLKSRGKKTKYSYHICIVIISITMVSNMCEMKHCGIEK